MCLCYADDLKPYSLVAGESMFNKENKKDNLGAAIWLRLEFSYYSVAG